jgi:hypothetical protein
MKKLRCNKADELYCFLKSVTGNSPCWHSKEHEHVGSCEEPFCDQETDQLVAVKCVRVNDDNS